MKYLLKAPDSRKKFIIFIGDIILIAATILLIVFLYNLFKENYVLKILKRPLKLYALYISVAIYIIALYTYEMYEMRKRYERLHIFTSMLGVSLASFLVMFALAKVLRINQTTMVYLFVFFICSAFLLYFWRKVFVKVFLDSEYFAKRILFLGKDSLTDRILNELRDSEYQVSEVLNYDGSDIGRPKDSVDTVNAVKSLERVIKSKKAHILVLALNTHISLPVVKKIYKYKLKGVEVYRSDYFYEILTKKFAIEQYLKQGGVPFPNIDTVSGPVFKNTKKLIDFFGALFGLIVLSPLFLITAILIKLTSKGPVFYLQERTGFQEKPFRLIKFRTMIADAEKKNGPQWASKYDTRVTKIGRFLRKTRLDELPQLINVLKGELSFVGPRPIRRHFVNILENVVPFYSIRFDIKPGLTGWAQVNYDYGGSIEGHIKKFQYDLYYLKHASSFLDLFIILKTVQTLIRRPAY